MMDYIFVVDLLLLEPLNIAKLEVYIGNNELHKGRIFKVKAAYIPENYDPNEFLFDAGVLKLKTRINFSDPKYSSSPLKLPVTPLPDGARCNLFGFGFFDKDRTLLKKLQMASMKTMNWKDCKNYLIPGKSLKPSQMCGGVQNGANGCSGDSGGPLVYSVNNENFVYGVFSKTTRYSCNNPETKDVFTNVENNAILKFYQKHRKKKEMNEKNHSSIVEFLQILYCIF